MAAFPKERRWLTRDTALLIHGRRMVKDLHLEGPLGSCRRVLEEMIADIDHGLRLEEQAFAELISGTRVDAEEIKDELDDLLDEIDGVLEENAEEFVRGYVQKGGE